MERGDFVLWLTMDPKQLKVAELRAELSARGLSTDGLKSVLIDRLQEFLDKDESSVPDAAAVEETAPAAMVDDDKNATNEEPQVNEEKTSSPKKTPKKTPKRGRSSSNVDSEVVVDVDDSKDTPLPPVVTEELKEVEQASQVVETVVVAEEPKPKKKAPPPVPPPPLKHQKSASEPSSSSSSSSAPPPPPPPANVIDPLQLLANENWSTAVTTSGSSSGKSKAVVKAFNIKLVEDIYQDEISNKKVRIMKVGGGVMKRGYGETLSILESSSYLEHYLWPHFNEKTISKAFIFSIAVMINTKINEGVPPFDFLKQSRSDPSQLIK
jgi:hypothetical protein